MKNLLKIAVVGTFLFGLVDLPRFVGPVPVPWVFMPLAFAETGVPRTPQKTDPVQNVAAVPLSVAESQSAQAANVVAAKNEIESMQNRQTIPTPLSGQEESIATSDDPPITITELPDPPEGTVL